MADRYDHETLLAYVEGDLSDDARARFEAQLAEDAELRRLVEGLVRDRAALRGLMSETPPPAMVDDAIQQLERQMLLGPPSDEPIPIESARRPPRRHRLFKTLAYAGIAAIMLLSGGLIVLTLTDTNAIDTARRIVQLDRNGAASSDAQPRDDVAGRAATGEPPGEGGGLALDAPTALAERAPRPEADVARPTNRDDAPPEPGRLTLSPVLPDGAHASLRSRLRLNGELAIGDSDWAMPALDADAPDAAAATAEPLEPTAPSLAQRFEGLTLESAEVQPVPQRQSADTAAATPAASPQRWQVTVVTDDVARTQAALSAWAASNRVVMWEQPAAPARQRAAVQEPAADERAQPEASSPQRAAQAYAFSASDAPDAGGTADQVTRLRLGWQQVPALLASLNRDDVEQRAELTVPVGGEQMPPSPVAWDELLGQAKVQPVQPPLRRSAWAPAARLELEVVIVPTAAAANDATDATGPQGP